MALEIKLKQEPIGTFDSKLGELYIFRLTMGGQKTLQKLLEKTISEADSESFVKSLIIVICYKKDELLEGIYRPDKPSSISKEDIDKFSIEDLENFAKIYIQNNEYLFKESKNKTKKNERGNLVSYQEFGEIVYPQEDAETYVDYLQRLSIIENNLQREQVVKIAKSIGAISGFSNNLTDSIKNSLQMGNSLKKKMKAIRSPNFSDIRPSGPQFDYGNIIAQQEKNRLAPFNKLARKLDDLIGSSVQTADFIVETNKIQAGIASELKESGDNTNRFSKVNIAISCFIIFLTICSLYMAYSTSKSNEEQKLAVRNATEKNIGVVVNEISGLSSVILNNKDQTDQIISIFVNELKELSNSNMVALEGIVTKQSQMLTEIRLMNEKNMERIKDLENKIKKANEKNSLLDNKRIYTDEN